MNQNFRWRIWDRSGTGPGPVPSEMYILVFEPQQKQSEWWFYIPRYLIPSLVLPERPSISGGPNPSSFAGFGFRRILGPVRDRSQNFFEAGTHPRVFKYYRRPQIHFRMIKCNRRYLLKGPHGAEGANPEQAGTGPRPVEDRSQIFRQKFRHCIASELILIFSYWL